MKDALFLRDEQIKDIIELILFAYRDTFLDSKNIYVGPKGEPLVGGDTLESILKEILS